MTRKQYQTYWEALQKKLNGTDRYCVRTRIWRRRGQAIVVDLRYGYRRTGDLSRSRQLHVYWHPDEKQVVCEYHVEHLSPRIVARGFDALFLAEEHSRVKLSSEMGIDILLL